MQEDLHSVQPRDRQAPQVEDAVQAGALRSDLLAPFAPISLGPAADLACVSRQALNAAILSQRLQATQKISTSGRNANRPYWEVRLEDLFKVYPQAQARWEAQQAERNLVAARQAAQDKVVAGGPLALAASQPAARSERGLAKAWHVTRFQTWIQETGHPKKRGLALYVAAVADGLIEVPVWVTQAHCALSERSLERWAKAIEQGGTAALDPRYGEATAPLLDLNPEMGEYALSLLTQNPHLRISAIHAGLSQRFGQATPSASAVGRWLKAWKEKHPQDYLLLTNPDKFKSKYQVALGSRSEHLSRPNELWETDATKVDLIFSDDPRRWTLLGLVDVFTDRRLFMLVEQGSGREHGRLIREGVLRWGWPDALKTDNGKDYTSQYMTRLFADMGIQHLLCAPFSGEEKPHVERAFGVLQNDLVEMLPGFCGHSVAQAQDIRARKTFAERLFKRSGQAGDKVETAITRAEFQAFLDAWMQADLGRRRTKRSHLKGQSPQEVLDAWLAKGEAPLRACKDVHLLDYLLLPVLEKTIGKKGIQHMNRFYVHELMGAHVGDRVECRLDPEDLGHMSVFDQKGTFLFLAQCLELLGRSSQEVAVQARIHQRSRTKAVKAYHRDLKTLTSQKTVVQAVLDERLQGLDPVSRAARIEEVQTETLAQAAEAHAAKLRAKAQAKKALPEREELPLSAEEVLALQEKFRPQEREEDPVERYLRLRRKPLHTPEEREWLDWFLAETPEGRSLAESTTPQHQAELA